VALVSEYIIDGVPMVEEICTDILEESGIEPRGNAKAGAEELVAPQAVVLGSSPEAELPHHFKDHVGNVLHQLEAQYDEFLPTETALAEIEKQILGTIGLGLEGRLPGPQTVPRHINHAGQADPPAWAAEDLPKTSLPTDTAPILVNPTSTEPSTRSTKSDAVSDGLTLERILTTKNVIEVAKDSISDEVGVSLTEVDGLTQWYILCYLVFENTEIPFDQAKRLGMVTGIDITEHKISTRIWSKFGRNVHLNDYPDRVQKITEPRKDEADDSFPIKYPVDPTRMTFRYTIDAVHAALFVFKIEGPQFTRD